MFCANFARIEGSYYQIDDLMGTSLRRVLNLTYTWLFDLIGGTEVWDKEYKSIFDPNAHEDFDYVDVPESTPAPSAPGSAEGDKPFKPSLLMGGI